MRRDILRRDPLTLATHVLPYQFGALDWTIRARSDDAFRRLIVRFLDHYLQSLFNPDWGEQAHLTPDNELRIAMTFQGLPKAEALAALKPLTEFVAKNAADFETASPLTASALWASWFYSP